MKLKPYLNREPIPETVKPGDVVAGVQICPFGNFKGEKSLQVCDRAAFEQLLADWQANGAKEILMDFEHQSEAEKIDSDTRAAAWISNLAIDDTLGLVGDFKFTDEGAEAVTNRRLRFLSPTWFTDKTGRPTHMTSVALTNKPNIPVAPILNKSKSEVEVEERIETSRSLESKSKKGRINSSLRLGLQTSTNQNQNTALRLGLQTSTQPTTPTKGPEMDIEKLKQALGLPAEATEEQVLAAIKEGQDAKAQAAEMAAKAERDALECEAEKFADENKCKCNKEVLKAQYIANKDVAKALVAGIPDAPKEDPQKILNKATDPQGDESKEIQRNKAIGEYRTAHGCDFQTAWGACRVANPELFQ